MPDPVDRRTFATTFAASIVLGSETFGADAPVVAPMPHGKPTEAPFERDYPKPGFNPSWRRPQINRLLIQDFVVYAHTDAAMVSKLLDKEPALVNSFMDWGGGDWESGLGAAAHMGNRAMAELLLERGARIDIFCATMMGQLDAVKAFLTLQPKLIDAKGPHGFSLHFHAQLAGKDADKMVEYLQSVKKIDLPPNPFLRKPGDKKDPPKKS
ncbi:Ankyrin repeats (3 copies) [Gemmata sp. SH-PL17]|uniref:ankyrin repeat domain-containing protein n=1 Tax=Gemmata sp. SH-PL17 TaxID=1630693 RepID=UPI0004AE276A|nr:ankyrin repeat domain-containing protein [Gemmata sp. SH-PL17]AMV29869.1 Ankyrin repeats (3 copies) [Gemmata sp. SH-PL17]